MATKVFVGRFDYGTTDQELEDFLKAQGNVQRARIQTRGGKSLGYAFVEFSTPEATEKAVANLNNTEFKGKPIKVEVARERAVRAPRNKESDPHSDAPQEQPPKPQKQPPRQAQKRAPPQQPAQHVQQHQTQNQQHHTQNQQHHAQNQQYAQPYYSQNRQSGWIPKPYRNQNYNQQNSDEHVPYQGGATRRGNRRRYNNRYDDGQTYYQAPANAGSYASGPQESAYPRNRNPYNRPQRRPNPVPYSAPENPAPPKEKIQSKTAVFVANLPFSLTDKGLEDLFTGFAVKNARIVRARFGKSRGYGFVDFETEKDQANAIAKLNKTTLEDPTETKTGEKRPPREITVTVSHSVPPEDKN